MSYWKGVWGKQKERGGRERGKGAVAAVFFILCRLLGKNPRRKVGGELLMRIENFRKNSNTPFIQF